MKGAGPAARREAIHRIAEVLRRIPGTGGGTATATIRGYIGQARDLDAVRKLAVEALNALSFFDAPPEAWEGPIAKAEAYFERRFREGWDIDGAGRFDEPEEAPDLPERQS